MKAKPSFTVDKQVVEQFNKLANKNSLNKSKWVENQMIKYIEDNKDG